MRSTRGQGCKSKRGESDIRQGDAQSRALAYMPRAATTASGVRRQFLAHAQSHQFRKLTTPIVQAFAPSPELLLRIPIVSAYGQNTWLCPIEDTYCFGIRSEH